MAKIEVWSTYPLDNEKPYEKIAEFSSFEMAKEYCDMIFAKRLDVLLIKENGKIIYAGGDSI